MGLENLNSNSLSIDQRLRYLAELPDRIHNSLLDFSRQLPPDTLDNLDEISEMLAYIGNEITEHESERNDLLVLSGIGQVINSSLNLDDVLRIVMDTIVSMTGAERGFLMLKDNNGEMSIHIARNWEQETVEEADFAISRTVVNSVISDCQPVHTTNAQRDPRFDNQDSIIAYNLRSILCVPLQLKGELIGVIYIDNRIKSGIFGKTDRNLLVTIADQAAVAIENARLFESMRESLSDVTDLKNLMDDVFTSITSGVITINGDDIVTLSNQAAKKILGQDGVSMEGQHISRVLPWMVSDLNRYLKLVRNNSHQILGLEYTPLLPDRGPVTLNLNITPLKGDNQYNQGIAIVIEDQTEKKRLEAHQHLFKRMVSPAVIEELGQNKISLSGKRTFITTLFADIRDFTKFSEQNKPEQLVQVLNRYLGIAVEAVLNQEGTVDKFQGDSIMAFFNSPLPQPDHVMRAVRSALEICKSMKTLQEELPPGLCLSFGIGIHFGEAILGLIGTERRVEYTAIGDSVNTAKRLQENANGGQILISAAVYSQVAQSIKARQVNSIQAKGKSEPIKVYELLGLR